MGTVLVAIDFSEGSLAAFKSGEELAFRLGLGMTLVHVVPRPGHASKGGPGLSADLAEQLWDGLYDDAALVDQVREQLSLFLARAPTARVPVNVVLRAGPPATAIVEAADRIDARVIVLSTAGRRGLERLVVGSTAEEVVRRSDVPVLTIKAYAPLAHFGGDEPEAG